MKWYYADAKEQQIEVDESELDSLIESGAIKPNTLVWNETMKDWVAAGTILKDRWDHDSAPPLLTPQQQQAAIQTSPGAARPSGSADGICICAMVFGILGLVTCVPLFGLAGVICGHIGRKRALDGTIPDRNNAGFALAGLITGYIGIVVTAIAIIAYIALIGFAIAAEGI